MRRKRCNVPLKVKLKSDFVDFYDHWFDSDGIVFERMSKNKISRLDMFRMFEEKDIPTPINGVVRELDKQLDLKQWVVVYLDEFEHQGNGKVICNLKEALEKYPDYYASEYISTYRATSWRELFLGDYGFLLKYKSDDLWRSNVGDVEITIEEEQYIGERLFDFPVYAIDYVFSYDGQELKSYAIDLNTSPMAKGTGVEKFVKAKDVVDSIKSYEPFHNKG